MAEVEPVIDIIGVLRLADVVGTVALPCTIATAYKNRSRGAWPWLTRRGRELVVEVGPAIGYWRARGEHRTANALLARLAEAEEPKHKQ